ncbi:MAG: hypothetical protein Q7S93_10225 [Phenylobacterium sp.]|nr:hypothetical protein [Phenylobacterium sp.]
MLAMVALGLKILIPPGYMAAPPQAEGPGFNLVLCTAQGMIDMAAAADDTAPSDKDDDGARHSPCVFAGHSVAAAAPDLLSAQPAEFQPVTAAGHDISGDIAPGRGLAAPPPPPRGPPQLQA